MLVTTVALLRNKTLIYVVIALLGRPLHHAHLAHLRVRCPVLPQLVHYFVLLHWRPVDVLLAGASARPCPWVMEWQGLLLLLWKLFLVKNFIWWAGGKALAFWWMLLVDDRWHEPVVANHGELRGDRGGGKRILRGTFVHRVCSHKLHVFWHFVAVAIVGNKLSVGIVIAIISWGPCLFLLGLLELQRVNRVWDVVSMWETVALTLTSAFRRKKSRDLRGMQPWAIRHLIKAHLVSYLKGTLFHRLLVHLVDMALGNLVWQSLVSLCYLSAGYLVVIGLD